MKAVTVVAAISTFSSCLIGEKSKHWQLISKQSWTAWDWAEGGAWRRAVYGYRDYRYGGRPNSYLRG